MSNTAIKAISNFTPSELIEAQSTINDRLKELQLKDIRDRADKFRKTTLLGRNTSFRSDSRFGEGIIVTVREMGLQVREKGHCRLTHVKWEHVTHIANVA